MSGTLLEARGLRTGYGRLPVVFNVDFGHTDPQVVIPAGGWVRLDGRERRITVRY